MTKTLTQSSVVRQTKQKLMAVTILLVPKMLVIKQKMMEA